MNSSRIARQKNLADRGRDTVQGSEWPTQLDIEAISFSIVYLT
jgi:hypothetical protein